MIPDSWNDQCCNTLIFTGLFTHIPKNLFPYNYWHMQTWFCLVLLFFVPKFGMYIIRFLLQSHYNQGEWKCLMVFDHSPEKLHFKN